MCSRSPRHDPISVYNFHIRIEIPPHKPVLFLCDVKRVIKYGLLDKGRELLCDIRLVLLVGLKLLTRVKNETASPGCHDDLE